MITRQQVIDSETAFPRGFADVQERLYGLLFFNLDNPQSHDSNHAVILQEDAGFVEVDLGLTSWSAW